MATGSSPPEQAATPAPAAVSAPAPLEFDQILGTLEAAVPGCRNLRQTPTLATSAWALGLLLLLSAAPLATPLPATGILGACLVTAALGIRWARRAPGRSPDGALPEAAWLATRSRQMSGLVLTAGVLLWWPAGQALRTADVTSASAVISAFSAPLVGVAALAFLAVSAPLAPTLWLGRVSIGVGGLLLVWSLLNWCQTPALRVVAGLLVVALGVIVARRQAAAAFASAAVVQAGSRPHALAFARRAGRASAGCRARLTALIEDAATHGPQLALRLLPMAAAGTTPSVWQTPTPTLALRTFSGLSAAEPEARVPVATATVALAQAMMARGVRRELEVDNDDLPGLARLLWTAGLTPEQLREAVARIAPVFQRDAFIQEAVTHAAAHFQETVTLVEALREQAPRVYRESPAVFVLLTAGSVAVTATPELQQAWQRTLDLVAQEPPPSVGRLPANLLSTVAAVLAKERPAGFAGFLHALSDGQLKQLVDENLGPLSPPGTAP